MGKHHRSWGSMTGAARCKATERHLVQDQHDAVLIAQLAHSLEEAGRGREEAALPHDGLHNDGCRLLWPHLLGQEWAWQAEKGEDSMRSCVRFLAQDIGCDSNVGTRFCSWCPAATRLMVWRITCRTPSGRFALDQVCGGDKSHHGSQNDRMLPMPDKHRLIPLSAGRRTGNAPSHHVHPSACPYYSPAA